MIGEVSKNLIEVGKKYSNVVFLCEQGSSLAKYVNKVFDDRCFVLGLGKQNLAAVAAGFCVRGKLPVLLVNSDFIFESYGALKECIVDANLNVKIVAVGPGGGLDVKAMRLLGVEECVLNSELVVDRFFSLMDRYGPAYFRVVV